MTPLREALPTADTHVMRRLGPAVAVVLLIRTGAALALHVVPIHTTLHERAADADAILVVRIVGPATTHAEDIAGRLRQRQPEMVVGDSVLSVHTEYSADVIEVLKPDASVGANRIVTLSAPGGRAEWGGRTVVVDAPLPELAAGGTYLVLLWYSGDLDRVMVDDHDVFRLDGPRVSAGACAGKTEYGKAIIGRSAEEAVAMVRAAVARQ